MSVWPKPNYARSRQELRCSKGALLAVPPTQLQVAMRCHVATRSDKLNTCRTHVHPPQLARSRCRLLLRLLRVPGTQGSNPRFLPHAIQLPPQPYH